MFTYRRWPFVTITVTVISLLLFLSTHEQLRKDAVQYEKIESRTLALAARYSQIPITPAQQALVDSFRTGQPQEWERMAVPAAGSAKLGEVTEELAQLGRQLDDFQNNSLTANFAVYPPHRSALSSITATFLHRDWAHLIFNICFLWLAGATLEDVWGKRIYAGLLLICSVTALSVYLLIYPDTLIPPVGASGMVAALMGAYVFRFPKTAVQRGSTLWFVRPRLLRISSPVYVVFPMWVLALGVWGRAPGEVTNSAYWAQMGAFAIGLGLGLLLWVTGVQDYVSRALEAELAWSEDPHIATASEYLERGDIESAINEMYAQIAEKPASVEAHKLLASLYSRQKNVIKYMQSLEGLCDAHLKASSPEAAWQEYENYRNAGGRKMPAGTWLELIRFAENQLDWERAVAEYEELAEAWPNERTAVLALISAGRIQFQQFGRREEAKKLYTLAQSSEVPHADWDEIILKALEKIHGAAAPKAGTPPSGAAQPTHTV